MLIGSSNFGIENLIRAITDGYITKNVASLPLKSIKTYLPAEIKTLQGVLCSWLLTMPSYKNTKFQEKLFENPPRINEFTFYAFKAFCIYNNLQINQKDGSTMTAKQRSKLVEVANGSYKNTPKNPLAEIIRHFGIDAVKQPICKIYKPGETGENVTIIKKCLSMWLSKMKYKNAGKELDNAAGFNKETFYALKIFNLRFGVDVKDAHTITKEHLKLFNDTLAGNLDPVKKPEYAFKKDKKGNNVEDFKRTIYGITSKKGPEKALKELSDAKSKIRRTMASRSGAFHGGNIINSGRLSGVNSDLISIFYSLSNFLNQDKYKLRIHRGVGDALNKRSLHPCGRAIDFSILKSNGQQINLSESKDLAKSIRYFIKTNLSQIGRVGFKNEYDPEERKDIYSEGGHMHISLPFPNTHGI